jgi:hypothetical protein
MVIQIAIDVHLQDGEYPKLLDHLHTQLLEVPLHLPHRGTQVVGRLMP